tara:strand:- start:1639 stop:2097 length:459 start_codon:yes stop_codon:yes gene_type:complete
MSNFEKAWKIAKELSLHERAVAEEFAHPDDMEGHRLRDKVPSWMNRSKTGELNPKDLEQLRYTAATSPFRFFDDDEMIERVAEGMPDDVFANFLTAHSLREGDYDGIGDKIAELIAQGESLPYVPECENCGAPAEGTGLYGSTQMSLCRGCA